MASDRQRFRVQRAASKVARQVALDEAISRIAALYENGELRASTMPTPWLHEVADELAANRERIATLSRDLADARAKLGQVWEEGWRAGWLSGHEGVTTANPYATAGEKER